MSGNSREAGRTTSSRVLALLGAFSTARSQMCLSDLARRSGLPITTAHRLINDLVDWGALERLADGRYAVGLRLWEIGCLAPRQRDLRTLALPTMQDLYVTTRENIVLATRDDDQFLYLEKISGAHSARTGTEVGGRVPLHATSVGKIFLAFSEQDLLCAVVDRGLTRFTRHTIVMPGRLGQALCHVRQTQVACAYEELAMGISSVAAPIFAPSGELQAALSIELRSSADVQRLIPAVRTAALGLTQRLSDLPPRDRGASRTGVPIELVHQAVA
ncbi:IclR family transcriptional regulator [Amycolatopsis alkalitolerans]|uniref:IclR family transcriptional regulator n=1 Tax=Amycolatopsis alkalitolerans TaxID=2547244 RepID=A0A5C4LUZ4_9PSEU|nr:IclR family transcriptional regulator [Amycolatopsis alkalitolerans]TNC22266.1 IclR family transcriptional regulator [Amycolatopsis alkalitolerans]